MKARDHAPDSRLHETFKHGTARTRRLYAGTRRLRRLTTDRDRRRLAANGSAPGPKFAIDRDKGFRVFAPGEFPGAAEIVEAANALLAAGPPEVKKGKHMRKRLLDPADLTADSPFMRFALSDPVISSVSHYLGVVPLLSYGDVWYSGYVEGDLRNSQLYHCDSADVTQVKAFIYCNDVELSAGPLTIVEAAESEALMKRLGYRFRHRVTDEQVREGIDPGKEHPLVGPAGTVCFVDTSRCFHFGSRVTDPTSTRVLAMFQYVTPTAFILPRNLHAAAPFRHLADGRSQREQLVLGAA